MSNEEIYDAEIAPKLLEIAKRCQELGFPMVASVEWELGETGRTESHPKWGENGFPSAKQRLVHYAARCNGNIDAMLFAVLRDAKKSGHSSICLQKLGCDNLVDTGGVAALTITTK